MVNTGGKMDKPYKIIEETDSYQIREFSNYDPKELFWHRDKEDRIIELLEGSIKIQTENAIPMTMFIGDNFVIRKEVYHRVIANKPFKIKVYFL